MPGLGWSAYLADLSQTVLKQSRADAPTLVVERVSLGLRFHDDLLHSVRIRLCIPFFLLRTEYLPKFLDSQKLGINLRNFLAASSNIGAVSLAVTNIIQYGCEAASCLERASSNVSSSAVYVPATHAAALLCALSEILGCLLVGEYRTRVRTVCTYRGTSPE